jgi:hypothetical protein
MQDKVQESKKLPSAAQDRQRALNFTSFESSATGWKNRLIWGDKKYVAASLLKILRILRRGGQLARR